MFINSNIAVKGMCNCMIETNIIKCPYLGMSYCMIETNIIKCPYLGMSYSHW